MKNTVLLVVDVQNTLIESHPFNERNVIDNIKKLIKSARKNNIEVVYVRHGDGVGTPFEKNTQSWEIYHEIKPIDDETIFDKKFNSAFFKTGLEIYLDSKNIENIILVGLQTEYCIDATCKSAFDLGYKVIIPEETNTTFSNEYLSGENLYKFYNFKIWNNRFARVVSMLEVETMICSI